MGFLANIFGNTKSKKYEEHTEETINPLGKTALAIVTSSQYCWQQVKPFIKGKNKKEQEEIEMLTFYECLYFFMHLTVRTAYNLRFSSAQIESLQGYLGPIIASTAVDTFFVHWPQDLKDGIYNDFFKNMNDAEIEYTTCDKLFNEDNPCDPKALISKLASNSKKLIGIPDIIDDDVTFRYTVITSTLDTIDKMNLTDLITESKMML